MVTRKWSSLKPSHIAVFVVKALESGENSSLKHEVVCTEFHGKIKLLLLLPVMFSLLAASSAQVSGHIFTYTSIRFVALAAE